jgi:hypothetical protein
MFGYQRDGLIGQTIETLVTPRPAYLLALEKTEMLARFSTVAGEAGADDAERDVWGFGLKFYRRKAIGIWSVNPPVLLCPRPLQVSGLHPYTEAASKNEYALGDGNVGFLVVVA